MSITQGLAELKLLDKRIKKLTTMESQKRPVRDDDAFPTHKSTCFRFISVRTKTAPVDTEELKASATANYQSFCDLLTRRSAIKRAIILKNATTGVKIGSWTGTIAEAIEQKASILYKRNMLEEMKEQVQQAKYEYEMEQKQVQQRLDRLLSSEMGKDVRTNPETVNALTASFTENNKVSLVDPLDSSRLISEMEKEVDEFTTNVDWILSEANGRTMISV